MLASPALGVVVFADDAFVLVPLTTDHTMVRTSVSGLHPGAVPSAATSIGAGLRVALTGLDQSEADSKIVVLLTDGVNNGGSIDPRSVADAAACDDGNSSNRDACVAGCVPASCGDGFVRSDDSEECDGDDLQGMTCEDLGFPAGLLACDGDCSLDALGCCEMAPC